MNNNHKRPENTSVLVNIDFNKVKHRIDRVTRKIELVIKKYEFRSENGDSDIKK
ncbi:hypothetical protein NIES4074_58260 [Cylindrospermum sp. NIES-4074]|nr:hypothetical protein NIES4074_58260 [Cylindrospermum sp. NIES-4074]